MNANLNGNNRIRTNITIRMSKTSMDKLISGTADVIGEITGKAIVERPDLAVKLNEPDQAQGRGYAMTYAPDGSDAVISIGIDPELMGIVLKAALKAAKLVKPLYAAAKAFGTLLESFIGQFKELANDTKAEYHSAFDRTPLFGIAHVKMGNADSYVLIRDDGYGNTDFPYEARFGERIPDEVFRYVVMSEDITWMPEGTSYEESRDAVDKMAKEAHPSFNVKH